MSNATADVWADMDICKHLDNITDTTVTVICRLDLYLPPFLFIIGLSSNTLIVVIMRSRLFRNLSTSLYMSVNAVTDNTSILLVLPAHYIFMNAPEVFDSARDAHGMCSFFNVIGWGTSDLGILITVAMTTERAIAIKYPLKASKLCTSGRAKVVVAGLAVLELLKVSHFIFKSRVVTNARSMLCDVDRSDAIYVTFYTKVWPWLHFCLLFLSYFLVIAGNSVLFLNIRRSYQTDVINSVGRKNNAGNPHSSVKNRQISLMLLIDSVSLIICTLPYSIICILLANTTGERLSSPGGKNLTITVTFYLLYVNRCLNFFLYCISGSRFRSALKEIFNSSSRASVLNRSTTRHGQSLSATTRSRDQHGDGHSGKYQCDVISSSSPEVMASEAAYSRANKLSEWLPLSIFLTSSSADLSLSKFKVSTISTRELINDVIITRL